MFPDDQVLIATLGAEPQVVTLVLDALLARGISITRVIVVHTLPHREPVRSALARLQTEFLAKQYYGPDLVFIPHLLAGSHGPLDDVTSVQEIQDAFECMVLLLRQQKHAGSTVHLSVAGGRKTMTAFAMSAAHLLFEQTDRIWHLVSEPDLIRSRALHSNSVDDVQLVSLPVASWFAAGQESHSRLVHFMENVLSHAEREVASLLLNTGYSNAEIADYFHKSPKTVANQLTSVYRKLQEFLDLPALPDRAVFMALMGRSS